MIKYNKFLLSFFIIIITVTTYSLPGVEPAGLKELLLKDTTLVVPGIGGEGVLLGEDISSVSGRISSDNFILSRFRESNDLYSDILKVESPHSIKFDNIIYYPERAAVLLSLNGKITSIIGLNNRRITSDSIELSRGINYILFNYGSEKLSIIKNSKGKIYIYLTGGITYVDDGPDNSIDMYILFSTKQ